MDENKKEEENFIFNKRTFIFNTKDQINNKYEKIEQLGKSTYSEIYTVNNKETNDIRVCKKISKRHIENRDEFDNEIKVLSHCDHPNIIKLYEVYEEEDYIYLILEYCVGGELDERLICKIEEGIIFTEKEAANIFKKMMLGISYIHSCGICHRNLKTDNILFLTKEDDSELKLISFELSMIYSFNTFNQDKKNDEKKIRMKKLVGNIYFISPEVIEGNYNEKCDIWSAGVILYFLLSGEPPFNGMNDEEIFNKIKKKKFDFPDKEWKNISKEAKDLIKKMICDENNRLSAQEVLEHEWVKNCAPNSKGYLSNINLESFKRYRLMHKIKKAIYSFIASRLTEEETKNLKNIFENIDVDHDGKISFIEMKNAIKKLNIPNTENEIENIFKSIDTDNNGIIDYTEFLSASLSDKQIMNKKTLLETFNMFDKDKSGKISKKNIVSVLHLNNEKIAENYIKKYDLDKDGEINYQEFLEMMEKFGNFNENKDK